MLNVVTERKGGGRIFRSFLRYACLLQVGCVIMYANHGVTVSGENESPLCRGCFSADVANDRQLSEWRQ